LLARRIKDIAKDSSIYGLSKVIGQAIGFFLIPLYTKYLSPEDYGILNIIGVASVSFGLIMTFGIDSATYRFAGLAKNEEEAKKYVASAQWMNLFFVLLITLLLIVNIQVVKNLVVDKQSSNTLLLLGIFTSVFSSMSTINRAYFRIKRKVKVISLASIINIFTSIASTILFVVFMQLGVIGALLGNMIGNLFSSVYLMLYSQTTFSADFQWRAIKQLLGYALPVLPAQLFTFAIPLYSQWSVKELLNMKELGMYAIGLKFTIPLTLLLGMFQQAYAPYKFEILKTDKNPKKVFSDIMNLFVLFFGLLVILVSFFGGYVLKFMTPTSFHDAEKYLFYIALIPLFQGLYFMFSAGLEMAKSPWFRPIINGAGFITVLSTNHFLVMQYGVPGAALSIAISWLVMAIGNLIYSAILYPISYNWLLITLFLVMILIAGFYVNLYDAIFWIRMLLVFVIISLVLFFNSKHNGMLYRYLKRKN
jgi:O-antigen/teichoic acid export membrane protein